MDIREKLTNDIIEELSAVYDAENLGIISNAIIKSLSNYEVTERATALTIYNDRNDRLLKRYAACMSVDGKSSKTIALYMARIKAFADFVGVSLVDVGTYDIRFYLASLKEKGVSGRTMENYRSYISSFYQWLTREDIIPKNPCDKIPPIKYKEEIRLPFSETEIDALRIACKTERQRAVVELLLSSGVRADELVKLNISDIDLARLVVHVREGKGGKERVTYMTEVCALHLKKYLFSRGESNQALFISLKKKERLSTSGVRKILKEIGKAAGVDNVHPHRFRRTFATNLAKRGMDIQTVSRLMGHSNIQTTMTYVTMDDSKIINDYKRHTA